MIDHSTLLHAYSDFYIKEGRLPRHEAEFTHSAGLDEKDMYGAYSSLSVIDRQLFRNWAEETITACNTDPSFSSYGVREKMLALCFTLLETLKPHRSLIKTIEKKYRGFNNAAIKGMQQPMQDFFQALVVEGTTNGEIVARPLIGPRYKQVLWTAVVIILKYWLQDESNHFEKSDIAVEKTVHLAMDLMAPNA